MTEDLIVGLVAVALGVALCAVGAAFWTGHLKSRGQIAPRSYAGRFYLTIPIWLMLVTFGGAIVLDAVGAPEALSGALLVSTLPVGFIGMVLAVWQPERLRPAWQRRRIELLRRREELVAAANQQGHGYIVVLTVDEDEEPVTSAADAEVARASAQQVLDARPDAQLATVLDLADSTIVATLQRDHP